MNYHRIQLKTALFYHATGEGGGGHRGGSHQVKEDGGQGDPHGGPARNRFDPITTFRMVALFFPKLCSIKLKFKIKLSNIIKSFL